MKRNCKLRMAALAALFLAVLCVPGYSAPTPEQIAERTKLLVQAIDNGNVEQAKACIKLGADVNGTDTNEYDIRPLLIYALDKKNKEIAELLIKAGANVNATGDYGETALMSAASNEYKDITELLIKSGADVNAKDSNRQTALVSAAGNKDITELLIKNGADINARCFMNRTALFYATEDVAEVLIKAGAEINIKDAAGRTPLIEQAKFGEKNTVEVLIKAGADVNAKDKEGRTALISAAETLGVKDIVELLIKAGADVNATKLDISAAKDENDKLQGFNALMCAAEQGNKDLVELLIKSGADVNATNWNGVTALMIAISEHIRPFHAVLTGAELADIKTNLRLTAELLVKAGTDIDTVFIHTIKHRVNGTITMNNVTEPYLNEAMVKLFIDLGADVNATDSEGISVLTYAALYGRNDIAELLKAAGARE